MKRKLFDGTMPRFLLAGIVNTLAGCGTMFLLYNLAGCSYLVSSAANYIVGGIVSFFLNKYFTFRRREWSWGQVWRFALNVAVCYGLAYGETKPLAVMALADTPKDIQEDVVMLLGMCLYVALNYFGQRFFAFR